MVADTKYVTFGWNQDTLQNAPLDANGDTSLRAVVEWANMPAHRKTGDWGTNRYDVNLDRISGGTITLVDHADFRRLVLRSNFHFFATQGSGVTVARSAAPGTTAFNHFTVSADTESHFSLLTFSNGSDIDGGSIWNQGTAQFEGCTFTGNSTTGYGGAIVASSGAKTYVSNSSFTGNSAVDGGGAIAALSGSNTNIISNSTFTSNSAVNEGGAIWVGGATVTIEGSTITGNHVTGALGGDGGGVYVKNSTSATITSTSITLNTTTRHGAGLFVLDSTLTMTGGSLSNNTVAQYGGGFYINATGKTVTLNQVTITENGATTGKGGGGYIFAGTLAGQLQANQLTGNTAGAGINGIGRKAGSTTVTLTVAPNQQTVELD